MKTFNYCTSGIVSLNNEGVKRMAHTTKDNEAR